MRALICLSSGVGNVLLATPMIAAVRSLGYAVDVFCNARCNAADLLRGWEAVEDVYNGWHTFRRYDVVARGAWCDIRWPPVVVEARDYVSPDLLDMRVNHEAEVNMTVARKLGYQGPTPPTHCEPDPPGVSLPDRFIAICPGYGSDRSEAWDRKLWPGWPGLTEGVRRADGPDMSDGARRCPAVVVLGCAADRRHDVGPVDLDLRGGLTLRQSAGALARAEHVVAIDNGLAHAAAALGARTTVLFGFTTPVKNRPLGPRVRVLTAGLPCQPCQLTSREHTCNTPACMQALTVDRVQEALR